MPKVNKNTYFVLVYAFPSLWGGFETPNSIFILESLLEEQGVMSSQIVIYSIDGLLKKEEIKRLKLKSKKENVVFLISICERRLMEIKEVCSKIFQLRGDFKESLIAIGGPAVISGCEIFLQKKTADIVILGEAEIFIPQFLKALQKRKIQSMPNSYILREKNYIYGGKGQILSPFSIYKSQKAVIKALEKVPEDKKKNSCISLEFARGCYFNCNFCYEQILRKHLNLNPKNWVRIISPKQAVNLIKIAAGKGFKRFYIIDETFASHPDPWLKEFLKHVKTYFPKDRFVSNEKMYFQFDSCPIDFQRDYVKKFIKEMNSYFYLITGLGVEALDKETLTKFNKPHKNNLSRTIRDAIEFLEPYIKNETIESCPNLIPIHPWTTFKKLRGLARAWYQWNRLQTKHGMDKYILFVSPNRLQIISEKLEIANIMKREKLYLGLGDNFKFAYAKKAVFAKNKNDTDISRFVAFVESLRSSRLILQAQGNLESSIKRLRNRKSKRETDNINKKIYQFYIDILHEAEREWLELTFQQYERACQIKMAEFLKILDEGADALKNLVHY